MKEALKTKLLNIIHRQKIAIDEYREKHHDDDDWCDNFNCCDLCLFQDVNIERCPGTYRNDCIKIFRREHNNEDPSWCSDNTFNLGYALGLTPEETMKTLVGLTPCEQGNGIKYCNAINERIGNYVLFYNILFKIKNKLMETE